MYQFNTILYYIRLFNISSILVFYVKMYFNLFTRKESELSFFDFDWLWICYSLNQNKRHVFLYVSIQPLREWNALLKKVDFIFLSEYHRSRKRHQKILNKSFLSFWMYFITASNFSKMWYFMKTFFSLPILKFLKFFL